MIYTNVSQNANTQELTKSFCPSPGCLPAARNVILPDQSVCKVFIQNMSRNYLEAFSVDDGGTAFVVFGFGGAMILIFMVGGASWEISFCIRSAIPGNIVVPPDRTMLAYKSFRMSKSECMMEL